MSIVARHSIQMVAARSLLPRWDLATHLWHGWFDYHLLTTGHDAPLAVGHADPARVGAVLDAMQRGELQPHYTTALTDVDVMLRLYGRR